MKRPMQTAAHMRVNIGARWVVCFCCVIFLFYASTLLAHEVRPAYLEMRQTANDTYDVLWKVPGAGDDLRLAIYVELPSKCAKLSAPRGVFAAGAYTERWSVKCGGGLAGGEIHIIGLTATMTDVLVRLERLEGTTQIARLQPSNPSLIVEAAPSRLEVVRTYLLLGVEHILSGVDHLLFILGLLLLVRGVGRLVKTVSAFTIAHSVTLSLAALGFVHVPPPPVEAVIALSIVFVACEVLRSYDASAAAKPSLAERQPWLVAFSFGLLHGLGFASGLSEAGLPPDHIPLALALFSVGVEIGHFGFIAAVFTSIALGRRAIRRLRSSPLRPQHLAVLRVLPAYTIGGVAMFWLIERIVAFRGV